MFESIVAWFAPHNCVRCGQEGAVLCRECTPKISQAAARCYRCHALSGAGRTCATCRRTSPLYAVHVATEYAGDSKTLIAGMKFGGARAAANPMARLMAPLVAAGDMLVPVPTATSRARARGFDQARLLAVRAAQHTALPCVYALRRYGHSRQVGASRQRRLMQLRDSFEVCRPDDVAGKHVVLVDDVMTTGATLEAAAMELKKAGAKRIEAIVFARS